MRSKALYNYLFEAGVLNGTTDEIDRAKREYRKLYKRQWKQTKRPRKEIRIDFTLKQFQAVKMKAHTLELKHTTYARQAILAAVIPGSYFIPYPESLQIILQLISMAAIASVRGTMTVTELSVYLTQVETLLLHYIQKSQ